MPRPADDDVQRRNSRSSRTKSKTPTGRTAPKDLSSRQSTGGKSAGAGGRDGSDRSGTTKRRGSAEHGDSTRRSSSERGRDTPSAPQRVLGFLRRHLIPIVIIVLVILVIALLFPMARTYYQTMRTEQQLQAQEEAIEQHNEEIAAENEFLNTEEGIEDEARKEGMVKEGEHAAVVTNSDEEEQDVTMFDADSVGAPRTWYYDFLDTLFGVSVRGNTDD